MRFSCPSCWPLEKLDYRYIRTCPFTHIASQFYHLSLSPAINTHPIAIVPVTPNNNLERCHPLPIRAPSEEELELTQFLDSQMHSGCLRYLVDWRGKEQESHQQSNGRYSCSHFEGCIFTIVLTPETGEFAPQAR